jgi:hypothetical protein
MRGLLFVYLILAGFILRYHPAQTGLDPSWGVALNLFHVQGVIHGSDVGFTYGPLAYLILPMAMGSNLEQGIAFQFGIWLLYAGIIAWLCFGIRPPLWRLGALALCLYAGQPVFDNFGYAGTDFLAVFLVILLLACETPLLFGLAIALTVLLALIKVSSGISALSALGLYAAFHWKRPRIALLAAAVPLLFCGAYLLYSPSINSLLNYGRSGIELSKGNSSAMSQAGDSKALAVALAMLLCYSIFAGVLWWQKQRAAAVALAAAGPLFLEFKHSFTREAGHVEILFVFLPLVLGAVLTRVNFSKKTWLAAGLPLAALAACWLWQESGRFSWSSLTWNRWGLRHLESAEALVHFARLKEALAAASKAALNEDRLPAELLARVNQSTVTIFPWENAYAAANPIVYRPLPVFQTYCAYTPFLDRWNAEFLADARRSPRFVLFEWQAIDGRHPLLDVPATTLELYRNYRFDSVYGGRVLLERRAAPLAGETRHVLTGELRFDEPLPIPAGDHPLIARVHLKFNLLGRLRDFAFRIPEIRASLWSEGGRSVVARIAPLVAEDGIPLNFLPVDMSDLRSLFADSRVDARMTALVFSGEGSKYFANPIRVDIEELPGITLQFHETPPLDVKGMLRLGVADAARIEVLNRTGVAGIGPNEVIDVEDTQGSLYVQGWAIDRLGGAPAGAVWIELDGKLYPASYGLARRDIQALFRDEGNYPLSGFEWMLPSWKLGASVHAMTIKVIARDGKSFYDGGQQLRFRIAKR